MSLGNFYKNIIGVCKETLRYKQNVPKIGSNKTKVQPISSFTLTRARL